MYIVGSLDHGIHHLWLPVSFSVDLVLAMVPKFDEIFI